MAATVISDTSCLIFIGKIGLLEFIRNSYQSVYITPAITSEYGLPVPGWITIRSPVNTDKLKELIKYMDEGEASAIALSLEIKDCDLLLDDLAARKYAIEHHLHFLGTLGVLLKAKQKGAIEAVFPYLQKLKQQGFRISEAIEKEVLKMANEL